MPLLFREERQNATSTCAHYTGVTPSFVSHSRYVRQRQYIQRTNTAWIDRTLLLRATRTRKSDVTANEESQAVFCSRSEGDMTVYEQHPTPRPHNLVHTLSTQSTPTRAKSQKTKTSPPRLLRPYYCSLDILDRIPPNTIQSLRCICRQDTTEVYTLCCSTTP